MRAGIVVSARMGAATPAAHAVDVAAAEGVELTPEGLFDFFTQQIPYCAIPRYVELAEEIPISRVGRGCKRRLRDKGVSERSRDLEALGLVVGPTQTPHLQ